MKKFPRLFSYSLKNLEPKVNFLLERFNLNKVELGKVRYCFVCMDFFGTHP